MVQHKHSAEQSVNHCPTRKSWQNMTNNNASILTFSNSENATFRALICAINSEEYIHLPMMYNKQTAKYMQKATTIAEK